MRPILEIKDLKTQFFTSRGVVHAVDGVNITINKGEAVGIVGESGCGKSVTALSILRLLPEPPAKIVAGSIGLYNEKGSDFIDLVSAKESVLRDVRGRRIAMIFQEPMTALNPVFTIGDQISEVIFTHKKIGKAEANSRTIELLKLVGIPSPEERVKNYPHELSGGMRQRIMIAMAIALDPELLIADEPTTALDVTIQAQILELLKELQARLQMSLLLITHDMGIIAETVDRVFVMYSGRIVETASTKDIFADPLHPYTNGLLGAIPPLEKQPQGSRLKTIQGIVPDLVTLPSGCVFRDRCKKAQSDCAGYEPKLTEAKPGHFVRCYHYGK